MYIVPPRIPQPSKVEIQKMKKSLVLLIFLIGLSLFGLYALIYYLPETSEHWIAVSIFVTSWTFLVIVTVINMIRSAPNERPKIEPLGIIH